jgi:hypothetical protein
MNGHLYYESGHKCGYADGLAAGRSDMIEASEYVAGALHDLLEHTTINPADDATQIFERAEKGLRLIRAAIAKAKGEKE